MTPHEIKGVMTGVVVSAVILVAMFTAGRIYRNQYERETQPGTKSLAPENVAAKGEVISLKAVLNAAADKRA